MDRAFPTETGSRTDRRHASVLMETILVLPLLLMLLGGVFTLGDLILGHLVVQNAGRYEAWSTHTLRPFPSTRRAYDYLEDADAFRLTSAASMGFRPEDGQVSGGNFWGWGRRGYARASAKLPFWTALIDVQRATMNTGEDPFPSDFDIHGSDALFSPSFDYHRISEQDIAALGGDPGVFRRSNPACELQEIAIILDTKFAREHTAGDTHNPREPYPRNPILKALSE